MSSSSGIGIILIIGIGVIAILKRCDWFKLCSEGQQNPDITARNNEVYFDKKVAKNNDKSNNKPAASTGPRHPHQRHPHNIPGRGITNCNCPPGQISTASRDSSGNLVCGGCFTANYTRSRFTRVSI